MSDEHVERAVDEPGGDERARGMEGHAEHLILLRIDHIAILYAFMDLSP